MLVVIWHGVHDDHADVKGKRDESLILPCGWQENDIYEDDDENYYDDDGTDDVNDDDDDDDGDDGDDDDDDVSAIPPCGRQDGAGRSLS